MLTGSAGKVESSDFPMPTSQCQLSLCEGNTVLMRGYSTIGNPLTTHLNDAVLDVHGWISFSTDIDNWVAKRVPLGFQNLAIGWNIVGEDYVLDGHGTGGIFGNGQAWYNWATNESNKYGRYVGLLRG
jgi:hypothetical protein